MQFFRNNKTSLYGGTLLILMALAYFMFFSGDSSDPLLTTTAEDPTSQVSRDLLITLTNLNVIRLDETIFTDPVFVSLSDFGVTIPPQPVGRRNPFAPL
jgi:hypothetical protein